MIVKVNPAIQRSTAIIPLRFVSMTAPDRVKTFVIPYVTLLEEVRQTKTYDTIPTYFSGPIECCLPEHLDKIEPLPFLPPTLSLINDRSQVPPRAFYGFQLKPSDGVRILKKLHYLEQAKLPSGISDKEAYLEAHITTIFPVVVDNYIKFLFQYLELKPKGIIPTFFADVIGDDKTVITILTIGDSWNRNAFLPSTIIARLAYFLEKNIQEQDLPCFYLAAHDDGFWRKPNDLFFRKRVEEVMRGERPVGVMRTLH